MALGWGVVSTGVGSGSGQVVASGLLAFAPWDSNPMSRNEGASSWI